MFDEKLARALDFTEEDLAANREGYMSKPQRRRLRLYIMLLRVLLPITLAVIFTIAFTNGLLRMPADAYLNDRNIALAGMGVVDLLLIGVAYFHWRKLKADLDKGEVAVAEGKISLSIVRRGFPSNYWLQVGRKSFAIPERVLFAFHDEEYYVVYYAPHTMQILSAEPIS